MVGPSEKHRHSQVGPGVEREPLSVRQGWVPAGPLRCRGQAVPAEAWCCRGPGLPAPAYSTLWPSSQRLRLGKLPGTASWRQVQLWSVVSAPSMLLSLDKAQI